MRIALVIGRYDAKGGGAERWTDQHTRQLLAHGHEVHLFARSFREAPPGASCHAVDVGRRGLVPQRLRFAERCEAALRRASFDVIHDMGDGWYADIFMPHHGTRAAAFEQNTRQLPAFLRGPRRCALRWLPRYRSFRQLEQRQYAPQAGRWFVALSAMVRDHMLHHHHVPPEQIKVIYNGVDLNRFRPCTNPAARDQLRARLGFGTETVFLFIAHNFQLKGLGPLLRALASLVRARRPVGLVVVGAGELLKYSRLAHRLGCAEAVRFVGSQPDAVPYYHAADVYAQPTFYDPCSLVVLEAMATGLPVITSRNNGVSELMENGREGFVLREPDELAELADAMTTLTDPGLRMNFARTAYHRGKQHSQTRNYNELLRLYDARVSLRSVA